MSGISAKRTRKTHFPVVGSKEGLVDRVVEAIQNQILTGRLAVGTKLPPEREFSDHLGVSRTVVREAVRIMVANGLLETRHGVGTTVRAMTREQFIKPLTLFLRTSGQELSLQHLHQVRSILEVETAGVAAEHASDVDIDDLRRLCSDMESADADPHLFADKDTEFHRRLAQTTHNPLLVLLLTSIQDLMAEVRTIVAPTPDLYERVMPTHKSIVACVSRHNPKGARQAMREHLETALIIQMEVLMHEPPVLSRGAGGKRTTPEEPCQ
jgi:GntR family transcriptional regulator, transcriptional repressor for pyruvate dehydrogenase complex